MKTQIKLFQNHSFTILLFLFIFGYIVVTYIYLRAHTAPPRWDDAYYLEHSEIIFNAIHGQGTSNPHYFNLTTTGKFNLISLYLHLLGGSHAPLIALLPIPMYFVFSTGFSGVAATFFALILAFNLMFYRLISETEDKPTALLAVVITSTMPLVYGLSRYFVVEYGLMVLGTSWIYLQIKSNHFREGHYNIWMGLVLGLGMLMKISFPLYVIGPIVWGLGSTLIETRWEKEKLVNVLCNGLIVLLVGAAIMGTWYFPNIKPVLNFAVNAGFGRAAQDYSLGNPFDVHVLMNYWVGAINIGTSAYYFFILVFLSVAQGIAHVFHKKQSASQVVAGRKTPIGIMLAWFLVPFIVFSFSVNKDTRYLMPALPPIGFIIARMIMKSFYGSNLGKAAIVLLLIFPWVTFGYTSLPSSSNYTSQVGPFLVIAPEIGWAARPVRQTWPLEQILITIDEDVKKNNVTDANLPILVGVVPSYQYFNGNNLGYFSTHNSLPFILEQFGSPLTDDWTAQKERLISKDYLITKTGNQGPSFAYNPYVTPLLLNGELPFNELARFKLPDGSEGIIYKSGITLNTNPSILHFIRNIRLGDQFGSLTLAGQSKLFIHPGLTTATQFEFDAAAFTKEKGEQTIKITGNMHPDIPEEAVESGWANVRLIVQVDDQDVIDTVVSVDKPVEETLTISSESLVVFIVENNGSPNTDWFFLSIE
jgi:4-amino-4-deoxy-L-arabinose transferase-like glycosyltransferase